MIWEKRSEIDETKSLRAFLFRIAYIRMLNLFRDHSKYDKEADPEQTPVQEEEQDDQNKDLSTIIENAISSMH